MLDLREETTLPADGFAGPPGARVRRAEGTAPGRRDQGDGASTSAPRFRPCRPLRNSAPAQALRVAKVRASAR